MRGRGLPIEVAAAILPIERKIALFAFQPDEAIPHIQLYLIHLPNNNHRQQGNRNEGRQVEESI